LTRDKVRLQSQLESLLEECQIKLSSVVSDLLGASGQRILRALAQGETDPARLADLGDKHLRASDAELKDALPHAIHRHLLSLYLARLDLIESQMTRLDSMIAEAMKAHQDAVVRLAELPGLGIDSAQQIIAEIGPQASAFPSAAQLASWVGVCPGRQESAGVSASDRLCQRQPFHASAAQSTCARCGQEGRLSASDRLSAASFAYGVRQSGLGYRPPPLSADLEGSSRGRCLCGTWTCSHSDRIEEKAAEARDTTQETPDIRYNSSRPHPNPARVIFEGVAGGRWADHRPYADLVIMGSETAFVVRRS
jgi:hypothetical protein